LLVVAVGEGLEYGGGVGSVVPGQDVVFTLDHPRGVGSKRAESTSGCVIDPLSLAKLVHPGVRLEAAVISTVEVHVVTVECGGNKSTSAGASGLGGPGAPDSGLVVVRKEIVVQSVIHAHSTEGSEFSFENLTRVVSTGRGKVSRGSVDIELGPVASFEVKEPVVVVVVETVITSENSKRIIDNSTASTSTGRRSTAATIKKGNCVLAHVVHEQVIQKDAVLHTTKDMVSVAILVSGCGVEEPPLRYVRARARHELGP
jgi:hypothetical protein